MSTADRHRHPAPNPSPNVWDLGFGAAVLALAAAALFIWFPRDIRGAFIDIGTGGNPEPGDAFFPVLLASALFILGGVHLVASALGRTSPPPDGDDAPGRLTLGNLRFFALFHVIVFIGMAVMYWLGPLIVDALNGVGLFDASYRQLVDTVPYKYIGYGVGGLLMTLVLVAWSEGGLRRRSLYTVAFVLVGAIVIFDVMLSNVPLPPNANY